MTLDDATGAVAWSASGRLLAAGSLDGTLTVLGSRGETIGPLPRHDHGCTALAWHPRHHVLASGGLDGAVHVVRFTAAGAQWWSLPVGARVAALAWAPAGDVLAVAAGPSVSVVSLSGAHVAAFPLLAGGVPALAWVEGGPAPLVAATKGAVVWLSPTVGAEPVQEWGVTGAARALAADRGRRRLAIGDLGGTLRVSCPANGDEVSVSGFSKRIEQLAWDATGRRLAVVSGERATVWTLDEAVEITSDEPIGLDAHDGRVTAVAYGGTGGTELAMADTSGHVARWRVEGPGGWVGEDTDPVVADLGAAVLTLAWHPRGTTLAAGSADGSIWVD